MLSVVARPRRGKSLLELNVMLAAALGMTDEEREAGKRLPMMRQARLMVEAMPKATRVGEFIALWTITKYREGATSAEGVAAMWKEPVRTMYRRLEEFREVWAPAGFDTPDKLADLLIADFRGRQEPLAATDVAKLLSRPVAVAVSVPGV